VYIEVKFHSFFHNKHRLTIAALVQSFPLCRRPRKRTLDLEPPPGVRGVLQPLDPLVLFVVSSNGTKNSHTRKGQNLKAILRDAISIGPCACSGRRQSKEGSVITRYHSNRGVSSVSRCAADLEIAERL
jgi:hypothetical protein